ncbi:MAG TPA: HAD family hydrolase [Pirellulaceae bacterium]|nr:HAD family hydrolase [Pirellulaceae bacterium]
MSLRDDEIRKRCSPLEPVATEHPTVLRKLDRIRSVLFDIYGTLLISASGDIGVSQLLAKDQAFAEALAAVGIPLRSTEAGSQLLLDEIEAEHERARQAGVDYPEVEIVEIWRRTLVKLGKSGQIEALPKEASDDDGSELQLRRLTWEYEMRVNPVWPMPGARECLDQLECAGLTLGLVSNAQFFTMELLRSLLFGRGDSVLFDEDLRFLSYQHGRAKPSTYLFELAIQVLCRRGIRHDEVLYVGNDMLNDIMPANSVGFRTALFAGDARSLRLREDEPSVRGSTPDLVVTDLLDLVRCLR